MGLQTLHYFIVFCCKCPEIRNCSAQAADGMARGPSRTAGCVAVSLYASVWVCKFESIQFGQHIK